ncbi:MAG: phage holin, LLH family [Butyricicoccaceae bacterium]
MTEELMTYLAAALAAVAAYVLLPLARAKLGSQRIDRLVRWAEIAVQAAEQVFAGAGRGTEKKAYAQKLLEGKTGGCTPDEADALIEAAVYAVRQKDGLDG